ncbi:MAG: chitin-binding protein [Burkholderiales bacterium]|nr:chitin-binding protein [Burkholderiales bacterium]
MKLTKVKTSGFFALLLIMLSGANASDKLANVSSNNPFKQGTLYFHAYVPESNINLFYDSMDLTSDRYTDLIMSNYIAGAMLGHNIHKIYPYIKLNKDYVYASTLGNLLQENYKTQLYVPTTDLIDPDPTQQFIMNQGEGGPFEIKSYYIDTLNGTSTPDGYSLINYVAIQKNIGYTIATQPLQKDKPVPAAFNNKYYAPMLAAYFHFNDFRVLKLLDSNNNNNMPAPNFNKCMFALNFINNNPIDIIMNYAYNQGYYGGLVNTATTDCITLTPQNFLAKYNNFANAGSTTPGQINLGMQYPYQLRFYLNELYDNSPLNVNIQLGFNVGKLEEVFTKVFQTLSYVDNRNKYVSVSGFQAYAAFNSTLFKLRINKNQVLFLNNSKDRAEIYKILETAISTLEYNLGADFSATTLKQL